MKTTPLQGSLERAMRIVESITAKNNVRSSQGRRRGPMNMAYRQLSYEQLETRLVLSGVTLITHGFNSNVDGWVTATAEAMGNRPDAAFNQTIYRLELTDPGHDNGPLAVTTTLLSGPSPTDADTHDPEIMLLLDWSDVAGTLAFGGYTRSTFDVAAAVADKLVSTDFLTGMSQPLATLPFHLLGHSRGGSLVGELAHQLGLDGVWVDQVTTLDPHPVDGVDEPFGLNFGDAQMVAWDNVFYWDNYWRENSELFDFNGEMIAGVHNLQLNELVLAAGGYTYEHSDVHLWYYGTIDTSTSPPANNGDQDVPNNWYGNTHPARDASGYHFSRIVGGLREPAGLFDQGTGRVPVGSSNATWPNLMQLAVSTNGSDFIIDTDTIPTSFLHQFGQEANVSFYLDSDRNPFNNDSLQPLHELTVAATASQPAFAETDIPLPAQKADPGTYYLHAQITSAAGIARYAYALDKITLVPPGGNQPKANNDDYTAAENNQLIVAAPGVLANDTSADPLTAQLDTGPAHGTLVFNGDGSFVYTPDINFNREDSFQYRAGDSTNWSQLATVTMTVDTLYPWHNGAEPMDVDGDTIPSPRDALNVIATLNSEEGSRLLPAERVRPLTAPFYDIDRDGFVSPRDALTVIAFLNDDGSGNGEGESVVESSSVRPFAVASATSTASAVDKYDSIDEVPQPSIEQTGITSPFTGFPIRKPRSIQLWRDTIMKWTDENLDEIFDELACDDQREWILWRL